MGKILTSTKAFLLQTEQEATVPAQKFSWEVAPPPRERLRPVGVLQGLSARGIPGIP
jgi:hypothetical protein